MKTLIGLNLVLFAISSLIILLIVDTDDVKEKIILMISELLFMGALSFGLWLMVG